MRNAEATIQHIIEQAAVLFNTRGIAGTSVQDVMKATGLTKGGIYRHFESKEALAAVAFRHAYQKLKEAYFSAFTPGLKPDQKLLHFLDTFRQFLVSPPIHGGCPILNTATEVDDTNTVLREEVIRAARDWEYNLSAVFQEGIDIRIFKPDTDPRAEARVVMAGIEGAILLSKLHKDLDYVEPVIQALRARVLQLKR